MTPREFVAEVAELSFRNAFNPYRQHCEQDDATDAPERRADLLLTMIEKAANTEVDALWVGEAFGYLGGRRTGLAFTDDMHVQEHAKRWGIEARPFTKTPVSERTSAVVWGELSRIDLPTFLWNVFPLHPFERGRPLSNRRVRKYELDDGEAIFRELIPMLRPAKLVAIGSVAAKVCHRVASDIEVVCCDHPSHGGSNRFRDQVRARLQCGQPPSS